MTGGFAAGLAATPGSREGGGMDADVAVVGLGAMGSATLWRLAARGVDVIGFERFDPGHYLGSSHGATRLFRTACMEHPALVPLARTSQALWRALEKQSGTRLLDLTGGLMIGAPDSRVVAGTLAAAAANDLPVRTLTAAELAAGYPQHAGVPDDYIAVCDEGAGVVRPEAGVTAAVDAAAAAGAGLYTRTAVSSIDIGGEGVRLRTAARDFHVGQVVVTAGPWLGTLVPDLPVAPIRTPMTWFAPREGPGQSGQRFDLDAFPVFIRALPDGHVIWGHGAIDGHPAKVGPETNPELDKPIDPDQCDRGVSADDYHLVSQLVGAALPGLDPVPVRTTTCMITRSPDGQFLLGRPRRNPRLVVAGGCSGHAFKHATGIGETLARIACDESPFVDLDFVDPNRFLA